MTALPAASAYHDWAPRYFAETAVSHLENLTVSALGLDIGTDPLLDVGCGRARRLDGVNAGLAVGVDLVPRMLEFAAGDTPLAAADVRALPFADATFGMVWCRLVIGHVSELERAYAELGRVCRSGGSVLVTDFHPVAVAAGHRRTYTDRSSRTREIEHFVHLPEAHERAARSAGLLLVARQDARVSPPIRSFYEEAGRLDRYEDQLGLPLVLALVFRAA
jgi:malonyl-CoA O-methyltransferase